MLERPIKPYKEKRGRKKTRYVPTAEEVQFFKKLKSGADVFLETYGKFLGFYNQKKVNILFSVYTYTARESIGVLHDSCTINMIKELTGTSIISTESWVLAGKKLFECDRDTDDRGLLRIRLGPIGQAIMDTFKRDHPEFFMVKDNIKDKHASLAYF